MRVGYNTTANRPLPTTITGGEAQIARLKATLTTWLDSLLLGPHDEAYRQTRARIGRVPVLIGRAATGSKCTGTGNAVIFTNGAGISALPGSTTGTLSNDAVHP